MGIERRSQTIHDTNQADMFASGSEKEAIKAEPPRLIRACWVREGEKFRLSEKGPEYMCIRSLPGATQTILEARNTETGEVVELKPDLEEYYFPE